MSQMQLDILNDLASKGQLKSVRWSSTDRKLHVEFLDGGGNFHKHTYGHNGHLVDWEN